MPLDHTAAQSLLSMMMADLAEQDALHQPTSFWAAASSRIIADLQCEGFARFRALASTRTFFVPSYIAQHHPMMTRAITCAGHEIGAHGHLHEKLAHLSPDQEAAVLKKSLRTLEEITGWIRNGADNFESALVRPRAADQEDLVHILGKK